MKNLIVLVAFLSISFLDFAQDTTWVQTFTFDSITTRRANFAFPQELNTKRFEKVLMYYKLKCSPLTTWDQYNCGEWDYLTYTRVFDHTGIYDSVRKDGNRFLANWNAPNTIDYTPTPNAIFDTYLKTEQERTATSLTSIPLNTGNSNSSAFFNTVQKGSRFQQLITASELLAAGIQAGDIQGMILDILNSGSNGALLNPKISIKSTTDASLTSFQTTGFLEVYNRTRDAENPLVVGPNEFLFYQPFTWDGTSNLIIEFTYASDEPSTAGLVFNSESVAGNTALSYPDRNGYLNLSGTNYTMTEMSDFTVGQELTVEFWAKGNATAGTNTTILEAFDSLNNRILNIHMPWSDNNVYFDAGVSSGYDRINKTMSATEMDNTWNHWAFVKKQSTGEMFIYKNGVLWHSGTNKTRNIGYISRFILGANADQGLKWKGKIDEFRFYNSALSAATIQANYLNKINATHPNWPNLMVYYDFDNENYALDKSANDYLLMPSEHNMIRFDEYPVSGVTASNEKPVLSFMQGTVNNAATNVTVTEKRLKPRIVIFEQQAVNRHFEITNAYVGTLQGNNIQYDENGQILAQVPFVATNQLSNEPITYYNPPYEIVKDVEIARYITPYGIQFDLGPNGFAWIYDVTDYQDYLKNIVDLAAHNTQELLDLKFAFIEGIPPRDLHKREPIWSDFRSYGFANMANDVDLKAKKIHLADSSDNFKIKTRMSGHGQVGNNACCEWVPNNHQIKVDGVSRFNWNIWEATDCGDNPNIGQGGTWPYAREGWCPGDQVKEYEFELTPFVTPGDSVELDYVINPVPANDPGQAGGNYIAAYDLISYSAPNFQNDAAIKDVLNPNNYEYYSKYNPTCSNPRVILKNTGSNPLTSCRITCWVTFENYIYLDWTGNLNFLEEQIVEIPVTDNNFWYDWDSSKTFRAFVHNVNGTNGDDEYNQNSMKTVHFDAPERIDGPFFVWLTTNNKASENNYRLQDHAGNIIFERTQLTNQTQYKDTFNLAPGCYSIIIEDTDSDGLSFWYSSQVEGETAGSLKIRLVGGSYIEFFPGDFGSYHRYDFSVGFTVDVPENEMKHEIAVFPNPSNGLTTVEVSGVVNNDASLEILDLTGRLIHSEKMNATANFAESFVDVSTYKSGTYLVKVITNDRVYTKSLVKQ
ncbi:MAG: T9SS type A sorting domain-containing protein [Crocinitomicaceae bacterium]|nr:T9SS type A sorting domain-containing protein [Crocinitomicaceae bacterium]MCF8410255.1 T9SS type A sorting domain-containing protein [Crocinitomicaceae bacterium]